jgi:hypothetical protein
MSYTGTYIHVPGEGLVRVSTATPHLERGVYFNKGNVKQYDPSARVLFESKQHKRAWLKANHLFEDGIIKSADHRPNATARNRTKLSAAAKQEAGKRRAWIQAQGGTAGLWDRIQRRQGRFL